MSIEEKIAISLAKQSGEDVADVLERVTAAEQKRREALNEMMETVKQAAGDKVTHKPMFTPVEVVQSNDIDPKDLRDVIVLKSESTKQSFITTNGHYCNLDLDTVIKRCQKDLAKRKKLDTLMNAPDLVCYKAHINVHKDAAEQLKAYTYDELEHEGFVVNCTRGKQFPKAVFSTDEVQS